MINTENTGRALRLAPVDYAFSREGTHPITFLYYFEQRQDFSSLREALAATLERFFPLKGLLVENDGNELGVVESSDSPLGAATFEESEQAEMPDVDNLAAMLRFAGILDTRIGQPLARFELIQLPQGSLLSASISHSLTDGYGYFYFMLSWAGTARGVDLPEPSHNRAALHFGGSATTEVSAEEILRSTHAVVLPIARFDARLERIAYENVFVPESFVKEEIARAQDDLGVRLSRNDMLTAWLWQKYVALWNTPGQEVSVSCAVDARRLLGELTPLYFGNASIAATCTMPYEQVTTSSIGSLGARIQTCVDGMDREGVEATLRWMEDLRARGWYRPHGEFASRAWHPETGLLVTSLARIPLDQIDFGTGTPKHFYPVGAARVAVVMAAPKGFRVLVGHPLHV